MFGGERAAGESRVFNSLARSPQPYSRSPAGARPIGGSCKAYTQIDSRGLSNDLTNPTSFFLSFSFLFVLLRSLAAAYANIQRRRDSFAPLCANCLHDKLSHAHGSSARSLDGCMDGSTWTSMRTTRFRLRHLSSPTSQNSRRAEFCWLLRDWRICLLFLQRKCSRIHKLW